MTVPHCYLNMECNIDNLMDMRKEMNEGLSDSGIKISVNDFVIKACATALQIHPEVSCGAVM